MAGLLAGLLAAPALAQAERAIRSQLTIHVDPPLLHGGGTVLVVAKPVAKAVWDTLPVLPTAPRFAQNPKAKEMKPGDRLFEVSISSRVTIIELAYPEGGTFGFNLVAAEDGAPASALRTKRIQVGSGYYTDRQTGEKIEWPDVSTIHIAGPDVSEGQSRLVRASSSNIMNARPAKAAQPGVTVYVPSAAQLEKALVKDPH